MTETQAHPFREGAVINPWDQADHPRGPTTAGRPSGPVSSLAAERTPLERALDWLQDRHAALLVDPTAAAAPDVLAAIHQAVMGQNLRKGDADALTEQLSDRLLGAGPLAPYFRNPAITEIMVVGRQIFVEEDGRIRRVAALPSLEAAIQLAQHLCRHEGREYKSSDPLMNFIWAIDGSRINLVHHDKAPTTGPVISIRKPNDELPKALPDLVAADMFSAEAAEDLVAASAGRLNLLFAGPPGSGKTVAMRAIAEAAIPPGERVITLEDVPELRLNLPHVVALVGQIPQPTAAERALGVVSLQDLYRNTLRMRYDRLLMGEVRGPEALDYLDALMASEGGGSVTAHLRTPELFIDRLYQISHMYGMGMPYDLIQRMVYGTFDLIIQVERDGMGHRHASRIVEVESDGTMRDLFLWDPDQAQLERVGNLSDRRQRWIRAHTRRDRGTA